MAFGPLDEKTKDAGAAQPMMTLTMEQIQQIVTMLKAPSPQEAAKQKEEEERQQRNRESMLELGRAEIAAKEKRERDCSHKKERGEWAIGGQEHTDGFIHPICMRCGKEFPKVAAQHGAQGIVQ